MRYTFSLLAGLLWLPATLAGPGSQRADLSGTETWGYWLQSPEIGVMAAAPHDLLVIDYSYDGSDAMAFSADDIQRLKDAGKIVLAYLSIGEAEDYRFYWSDRWDRKKPGFIGPENPDWPGNYKVRYWKNQWYVLAIRPYMDRILAAGFDGVYLDIIDAYYFWGEARGKKSKRFAVRMAKLVRKIAEYGRSRSTGPFVVCPQNGESLVDDASARWARRYIDAIDCMGMEDVFFNFFSEEDRDYRLEKLADLSLAGKLILNVEYIDAGDYAGYRAFKNETGNPRLIIYPAEPDRELDELNPPLLP